MPRHLPPLSALRAFEAAARHRSFSRAADELNLTHGAVSRAVRQLEDTLGVDLFVRSTRLVKPTEAAEAYAREVRELLDRLAAATKRVAGDHASNVLNVSTLDSFAARWLLPRLHRFRAAHPDIDLRLSASEWMVDFINDDFHLAIRYGRGVYPNVEAELLMKEDVAPVCSPALLQGPHALTTPENLRYHTLIHDDLRVSWAMWLKAAGVEGVDATRGPAFESSSHCVQAAIQGEGVALGRSALVRDEIAAGRLVRPFALSLPAHLDYHVVYPPGALATPKVKAFRDWLFEEVAREDATMPPGEAMPAATA